MISMNEWRWCGMPGHLIVASYCRFHLTTQVGSFRVSTVGAYYPDGDRAPMQTIGAGDDAFYETLVFRTTDAADEGCPACCAVADWCEIDGKRYATSEHANIGHMEFCLRYSADAPTNSLDER